MVHSVALIINKNARKFLLNSALISQARGMSYAKAKVYVTSSIAELSQVTHELALKNVDRVILCGGDGTYSAGVSALYHAFNKESLPVVSLVAAGTVCTIARDIGYQTSSPILHQIDKILHHVYHQHSDTLLIERPTLSIVAKGNVEKIGFIFGVGLVAAFFDAYESKSNTSFSPTPKKAALITARVFLESFFNGPFARKILEPVGCKINVDGHTMDWPASSLVLASVIKNVGLGMRVTYRAGEDVTKPHVIVSGLLPKQLGPRLIRVLRGRSIARSAQEPHFDNLAQTLNVLFSKAQSPYIVDGDLFYAKQITIKAGPVLRFLKS